jgi:transcriptional regulator
MLNGIVGIALAIRCMEGKEKLSQNRSFADRVGVIDDLSTGVLPGAKEMAEAMAMRTTGD